MNYELVEDCIVAFVIFCIYASYPVLLYTACNRRAPRWYRLARCNVRLFVRALHRTPY